MHIMCGRESAHTKRGEKNAPAQLKQLFFFFSVYSPARSIVLRFFLLHRVCGVWCVQFVAFIFNIYNCTNALNGRCVKSMMRVQLAVQ